MSGKMRTGRGVRDYSYTLGLLTSVKKILPPVYHALIHVAGGITRELYTSHTS